jgi:phosphohistidine phosphatase
MKTLLLMRHGKSSWDDPLVEDFDRPLTARGERGAKRIGRWLKDSKLCPDAVLCSTAVRARDTWSLVSDQLASIPTVDWMGELYHCPVEGFVEALQRLSSDVKCVLIVGHNPGLEDLVARLCGARKKFPTAALAHLECDIDAWSDFDSDIPCTLRALVRPDDLEK